MQINVKSIRICAVGVECGR